jgi:hypothetical protein
MMRRLMWQMLRLSQYIKWLPGRRGKIADTRKRPRVARRMTLWVGTHRTRPERFTARNGSPAALARSHTRRSLNVNPIVTDHGS